MGVFLNSYSIHISARPSGIGVLGFPNATEFDIVFTYATDETLLGFSVVVSANATPQTHKKIPTMKKRIFFLP